MDKEKVLTYKGRKIVILKTELGHHCAYGESKIEKDYVSGYGELISPNALIQCHGGITYSGKLNGHKEYFFGIDFAHSADSKYVGSERVYIRTEEEVELLAKQLVQGILSYEEIYPKLKKARQTYRKTVKELVSKKHGIAVWWDI